MTSSGDETPAEPKPIAGFLVILRDDASVANAQIIAQAISLLHGVIQVTPIEGDLDPDRIIETRVRSDIATRLVRAFQDAVWAPL